MTRNYEDIIDLDRPVSKVHLPMPIFKRAAQFSAFAALTGYDDCVNEAARFVLAKPELDEQELEILNRHLTEVVESQAEAELIIFVPDKFKDGGRIERINSRIVKVDLFLKQLKLADGRRIAMDDVLSVK